jgi:hypothetical protein
MHCLTFGLLPTPPKVFPSISIVGFELLLFVAFDLGKIRRGKVFFLTTKVSSFSSPFNLFYNSSFINLGTSSSRLGKFFLLVRVLLGCYIVLEKSLIPSK